MTTPNPALVTDTLDAITVDRHELVSHLHAFLGEAAVSYEQACDEYRKAVAKECGRICKHIAAGRKTPKYGFQMNLPRPSDPRIEIRQILSRVQASTADKIRLNPMEFEKFWKGKFSSMTELLDNRTSYAGVLRKKA